MTKNYLLHLITGSSLGLLALLSGAAGASEYSHPTVVREDAVDWTPNLVVVAGEPKPVALSIAEAGNQMVVGGRFSAVSKGQAVGVPRANVFAFSAADGTIHPDFHPVVDGQVWSVLSDGTSVYIGGNFKNVNGTLRPALAKLSLATGALDPSFKPSFTGGRVSDMEMHGGRLIVAGTFARKLVALNPSTGKPTTYIQNVVGGRLANSDSAQVFKFDISPDGQHLVAVGNFLTVDGQDRPRVFMLDLGATTSTLSPWNYAPLGISCTSTRTNAIAYVQDVDFAPDSSYFVLAAFGFMYQGYPDILDTYRGKQVCDLVSRFETDNLDPAQPTWINYTGGDSLKSVAVTGAAVYVQGHSRWLDNPFGRDSDPAPAVDRLGGGAIANPGPSERPPLVIKNYHCAKALDWDPAMPQESGGYQILPTAAGVWFVTDGARFGGELHRGIRFVPLSGQPD